MVLVIPPRFVVAAEGSVCVLVDYQVPEGDIGSVLDRLSRPSSPGRVLHA